ncbi:hypothetical protein O6H91_12G045200 [Diphasiastrum complanatum]|uniref:Uncharacterized protein n=1 Tax=Diphasiastrum complanatum TaxID=34168 RepID=A0ACC2C148_DIPCM|nr:hypothetical protein O6H91_12G045200 [Diphasiastrum complanatum]
MFHLHGIPDLGFLRRSLRASSSEISDKASCESTQAIQTISLELPSSSSTQELSAAVFPVSGFSENGDSEAEKERENNLELETRKEMVFDLVSDAELVAVPPGSRYHVGMFTGKNWAPTLLMECGYAISVNDIPKLQQLMWIINEVSSPYGDCDQRLASCFLQAFFYRFTGTGVKHYNTLCCAAEKSSSYNERRRILLKCQEALPYMTFGHVVANGALMEVLQQEPKVHIVDISSTFCSQWPTLLETLAMQPGKAPQVRLTVITFSKDQPPELIMQDVGSRLTKFARLMGIPFEFKVVQQMELEKLHPSMMDLRSDEALVINCIQSVHLVPDYVADGVRSRDRFLSVLHSASPKVLTILEIDQNMSDADFVISYSNTLRFFATFFDSLEGNFPRASRERMVLERICTRSMVSSLACDRSINSVRRQQDSSQWCVRLKNAGFTSYTLSKETVDDVGALLKRYKEGWGHFQGDDGFLYLTWRGQRTAFASAWKPR